MPALKWYKSNSASEPDHLVLRAKLGVRWDFEIFHNETECEAWELFIILDKILYKRIGANSVTELFDSIPQEVLDVIHPKHYRYSYFHADCPACLRGHTHSESQHYENLQRVYHASR